jgi:hypothetical protein
VLDITVQLGVGVISGVISGVIAGVILMWLARKQ